MGSERQFPFTKEECSSITVDRSEEHSSFVNTVADRSTVYTVEDGHSLEELFTLDDPSTVRTVDNHGFRG